MNENNLLLYRPVQWSIVKEYDVICVQEGKWGNIEQNFTGRDFGFACNKHFLLNMHNLC